MRKSEVKVLTQAISAIGQIKRPSVEKVLKKLTLKQLYLYLKYENSIVGASELVGAPILQITTSCSQSKVHLIKKSRFTTFFTHYGKKLNKIIFICKELDIKSIKHIKELSNAVSNKRHKYAEIVLASGLHLGTKYVNPTMDNLIYDKKENKLYLSIKTLEVRRNKIRKFKDPYPSIYKKFNHNYLKGLLCGSKVTTDYYSGKRFKSLGSHPDTEFEIPL